MLMQSKFTNLELVSFHDRRRGIPVGAVIHTDRRKKHAVEVSFDICKLCEKYKIRKCDGISNCGFILGV